MEEWFMDLLLFEDYIKKYNAINSQEWTTLYENIKSSNKEIQEDMFGFCALVNNEEDAIKKYLKDFEWSFETNSFGNSYYQKISRNINGTFEDEISFVVGDKKDQFEYLIAYRTFNKKYDTQIEINPKLVWYENLVKVGNEYLNPVTDECMIRIANDRVEVLTQYLKNFLCTYNKACIIAFDHRRFGTIYEKIQPKQTPIGSPCSYMLYTLKKYDYKEYNVYSNIIGKAIVFPYTKCKNDSLEYLLDKKRYADFTIGIDEKTGEEITFTCDENKLANYFGANPDAPHFLTPVFFNKMVLNKYKTDTRNYAISDGHITFLDDWLIPFTINKDDKVVVWLGDLGRIPFAEQLYWKQENTTPKGEIEKNFFDQQMNNVFVDKILPEKWLFRLIQQTNDLTSKKFGDVIFSKLSEADSSIYSAFILPISNNIDEYKEFLMQFCKIIAESINKKIISKYVSKDKTLDVKGEQLGSIAQLQIFFQECNLPIAEKLIEAIKLVYNSRNKLAGHSASIKEYNKLWKRDKEHAPNWISDSKMLLNSVNDALNDLIEEL